MTNADRIFIQNCKDILASPYSDNDYPVRPKWQDGTPAHTKILFGMHNVYDLREQFPIMTLRKINWHKALDEILWVYQRLSNNTADLNSKIWDQWADENGSIGKTYGYQAAKTVDFGGGRGRQNQVDNVIWNLVHNSMDRAILTNLWDYEDIPEMRLRPCYFSAHFLVTPEPTKNGIPGRRLLNLVVTQRSQDMFVANNWDLISHAMWLMIIAACVGMTPGFIHHNITSAHIYDRHIPLIEDMIERAEKNPNDFRAPDAYLAPSAVAKIITHAEKAYWMIQPDEFIVEGYQYENPKYDFEVAV